MRTLYVMLTLVLASHPVVNATMAVDWKRIGSAEGREFWFDDKRVARAGVDVYAIWFQERLTVPDSVEGRTYVRMVAQRRLDCARNRISAEMHAIYYDARGTAVHESMPMPPREEPRWRDALPGTIDAVLVDVVCSEILHVVMIPNAAPGKARP